MEFILFISSMVFIMAFCAMVAGMIIMDMDFVEQMSTFVVFTGVLNVCLLIGYMVGIWTLLAIFGCVLIVTLFEFGIFSKCDLNQAIKAEESDTVEYTVGIGFDFEPIIITHKTYSNLPQGNPYKH